MSERHPDREWWTAAELAEAALPDLPASRQGVELTAKRQAWRQAPGAARRRKSRGGGWEYHWTLLPSRAQQALLAQSTPKAGAPAPAPVGRDALWARFERLSERQKQKAQRALDAVQTVEALERGGMTRDLACHQVARQFGCSARTVWNWLGRIEGVRSDDRLPHLAPRHGTAARGETSAECDPEFWEVLKADYLRLEQPSFSACYRRAVRIAKSEGWATLPERTMRRRLDAEVPETTIVLCRQGVEALKRLYPSQIRDRTALHAMEAVNADYHRVDVFVRWPRYEGDNECEIVRPQLVAFQDIYSGRIVSWRVDRTPNKVGVSLALGDMIERFGIPEHILLDNGREFANKFLTGQVPTRYRFKVKDDDIPGILKTLGCEVHWATPYSGQSKPIERAFRDFCDDISKDPRLAGAYTGNRPDAKPENYGNRAIPLEDFLAVLAEGIEEHNARPGRRGQTTQGRSLLETFEDSYATAPIRKATEEQRRLWLMGAEGLHANSRNGEIKLMENKYWAPWMHQIAGRRVVARFDPADLHAGLHLYSLDSAYIGHAECIEKGGFFSLEDARNHAAAKRHFVKKERAAADALQRMRATEIGGYLDAARPTGETPAVEAQVVRPVFERKAAPANALKPRERSPEEDAAHQAVVADFEAKRRQAEETRPRAETERSRFRAAIELEARLGRGEEIGDEQAAWLKSYQSTAEYIAQRDVLRKHPDMLG